MSSIACAYAYAVVHSIYIYTHKGVLYTYINVCTYTHPHWEQLHLLCLWSGNASEGDTFKTKQYECT